MYIYRKDKSKIKINDTVYILVKKELKPNIKIEKEYNVVKLNNKKICYIPSNPDYSIDFFNNMNFFEGYIEVENI